MKAHRLLLLGCVAMASACLDDLEPPEGTSFCEFNRTVWMNSLLVELGIESERPRREKCAEMKHFNIDSEFDDVPSVPIEPRVNVLQVEYLAGIQGKIDLERFPCGVGGEATGEFALCGQPNETESSESHVFLFEVEEPIPLEDPRRVYELNFGFDGDGRDENNENSESSYYKGTDERVEVRYQPDAGWTIQAFSAVSGTFSPQATSARLIVDATAAALIFPVSTFEADRPRIRFHLLSHLGDRGRAPPHEWTGFVFPTLDEGPY